MPAVAVRKLTPDTKSECQKIARAMGYQNATVDQIDDDRVYILSHPVYDGEKMSRKAVTLVFTEPREGGTVDVDTLDGWVVRGI
jgi:hypothetical protein